MGFADDLNITLSNHLHLFLSICHITLKIYFQMELNWK